MPEPFNFMTSVQSVQLTGLRARSMAELHDHIAQVDGSAIYHHTHRFYRSHSFLGSTPLSDFAFWVGENLHEDAVGERLASIDPRDHASIRSLRNALLDCLISFQSQEDRWNRRALPGLEFHFCRSVSLVLPTRWTAENLEEFVEAIHKVDTSCLYFHLVEAPLHLDTDVPSRNDFSNWLETTIDRKDLAAAVEKINPYRGDLQKLRMDLLGVLQPGNLKRKLRAVLERQEAPSGPVADWFRRWRGGN
jgi:hypothetical protein